MNGAARSTILYDGGPRDEQTDTIDHQAAVIGSGDAGGVYERTGELRGGLVVYRWHPLTEAEAAALTRGDLRANQE
jgi:hypothetical protein